MRSVCVGSCPDPDCIISVECLATSAPRKVLHVQSISLWAPSCIGPYSQASAVNGLVHCAGQIPLEAGTMVLVPGEPAWAQAIRCFESCRCVLAVHRSALHQVVGGEYLAFHHPCTLLVLVNALGDLRSKRKWWQQRLSFLLSAANVSVLKLDGLVNRATVRGCAGSWRTYSTSAAVHCSRDA